MTQDDRDRLVLDHLWIVRSLANRIRSEYPSSNREDLISCGNLGLVKASRNYKALNKCAFSTYAYKYVRGEMIRNFARPDGHHDSGRINDNLSCSLDETTKIPDDENRSPERVYAAKEKRRLLLQALATLDKKYQDILYSTYFRDELIGRANNKLAKRKALAIKQLRTRFMRLACWGT